MAELLLARYDAGITHSQRMSHLDTLNLKDLYTEISELARAQGISSHDDWKELVSEVLDSHFDIGELNDDQDLEGHREMLISKWEQYQRESAPETGDAIAEDPDAPHA